jgi:hypothetical protein
MAASSSSKAVKIFFSLHHETLSIVTVRIKLRAETELNLQPRFARLLVGSRRGAEQNREPCGQEISRLAFREPAKSAVNAPETEGLCSSKGRDLRT